MRAPSLPIVVVLVAVAASVAWGVPALLRRHHATQAVHELGRILRAASVYYVKPRVGADSARMPCQFPPGRIRTTLAATCCDARVNDGSGSCDPARIEWNRALWNAMRFQVRDPQPFVFEYEASGAFGAARMTATAYGDLDCDGEMSTFRFRLRGDPRARPDDCVLDAEPEFEAIGVGE